VNFVRFLNLQTKIIIVLHTELFIFPYVTSPDLEGEIESQEVIISPEQPEETLLNPFYDLEDDTTDEDEVDLQFTTFSVKITREFKNSIS
jgi:hypothetical protein